MDMMGSRNVALDFYLARPGVKTGPYGGNGNTAPAAGRITIDTCLNFRTIDCAFAGL